MVRTEGFGYFGPRGACVTSPSLAAGRRPLPSFGRRSLGSNPCKTLRNVIDMVRTEGFEPPSLSAHGPKPCASASSATSASTFALAKVRSGRESMNSGFSLKNQNLKESFRRKTNINSKEGSRSKNQNLKEPFRFDRPSAKRPENSFVIFRTAFGTLFCRLYSLGQKSGAPGVNRTPSLLVRSQLLYPIELRAREPEKHHSAAYPPCQGNIY